MGNSPTRQLQETPVRDRPTNWKRVNDSLLPKVQLDFWSLVHVQLALKLWEENQKPTRSNSKSNLLSNPELSHAHLSPVADILKNPPFRWKNLNPGCWRVPDEDDINSYELHVLHEFFNKVLDGCHEATSWRVDPK